LDIRWRVLVFARDKPGPRVGDGAPARQRQRQVAIGERRRDRRLRRRRHEDGLAGADRDASSAGDVFPELADGRMGSAPLLDDRLDLFVAAGVMWDDAAPSADGSTKSGSEFGTFAKLAFRRVDLGIRWFVQHLARDHPVRFEGGVAGLLVGLICGELPAFVG
jgi:hypothetical protein